MPRGRVGQPPRKGRPPAGFQTGLISPIFTTGTNFLGFESFFTFEGFLAFLIALGLVLTSSTLTYPFLAQNDIPGAFLVSTSDCPGRSLAGPTAR